MLCQGKGQVVFEELDTSDKEEEDAAAVTALDRVRETR